MFHLAPFDLKLVCVADVLICTPATSTEVRTLRLYPIRRRFEHVDQFCFRELLFLTNNSRRDAFAIDRERNEYRFAFVARDAAPTERDLVDAEFQNVIIAVARERPDTRLLARSFACAQDENNSLVVPDVFVLGLVTELGRELLKSSVNVSGVVR